MTEPSTPRADPRQLPVAAPRRPASGQALARAPGQAAGMRQRRRRRRWLAVGGYLTLALACALVGSITFLLVAAPVDFVRDQLVQQVKARTGRDLQIGGPTSIALLPQLSVHLADVSLSEPPSMGGGPLLTAQAFTIDVPLASLLTRRFAIKRLLLVRPTIELRIDAEGRRNWTFANPAAAGAVRQASAGEPAPEPRPQKPLERSASG